MEAAHSDPIPPYHEIAAEARMSELPINSPCLVIVRPLPRTPSPLTAEERMQALTTGEATLGIDIGRANAPRRRVRPPDGLRTKAEAASKLGCSIKTLDGHVASGALRYVALGHGRKRPRRMFTDADLDAFINNQSRRDAPCPSSPSRARRISTSTSESVVIAFTAAPKPRPGAKLKK
jgi:hypothetical protein